MISPIQRKDRGGGDSHLMFNKLTSIRKMHKNEHFDLDDIDVYASYKAIDQYHEKTDIVFVKNVKYLNPPEAYKEFIGFMRPHLTETFVPGFVTVEQACSVRIGDFTALYCPTHDHDVVIPSYSYVGDYNPIKGDNTVKASASRLTDKLFYLKDKDNNSKGGYLIGLDLTFPKEVSEQLLNKEKRDKVLNKAKLCIKDLIAYLKSVYCDDDEDIGLYYNMHIWSTENPLKPHLHYHVNLLNFISKKEIVKSVEFREEYKAFSTKLHRTVIIDPDDPKFSREYRINEDGNREPVHILNALKRFNPRLDRKAIQNAWSSIVNKRFRLPDRPLDIYMHYIPLKNRSATLHRIKYCSRKPLMDLWEYYTEHSFNPEAVNKDYIDFLMRYQNRRTAIGFARMLNRFVIAEEVKRVCPVCGNPAKRTEHYSFADIEAKLLSGSYAFIQWDHKAKEYEIIRSKRRLKEVINKLKGGGCSAE